MQTAFFLGVVFPPPATGAEVFALLNGAGAGLATNAHKAPVMERIVGYIVVFYILLYFFKRPVHQWVEFEEVVRLVPFELSHGLTVGRLVSADTRNPNFPGPSRPGLGVQFYE